MLLHIACVISLSSYVVSQESVGLDDLLNSLFATPTPDISNGHSIELTTPVSIDKLPPGVPENDVVFFYKIY